LVGLPDGSRQPPPKRMRPVSVVAGGAIAEGDFMGSLLQMCAAYSSDLSKAKSDCLSETLRLVKAAELRGIC
jgi:hypothetical protein